MKDFNICFDYGKSKKIDWIPNDTKEQFEVHLKRHPNSKLNYYETNPIEYKLNNYGFRTDDDFFDGDEGTVYLGCSHTFGIGHHLENVWSYKLHKKVGEGKFFNLSYGGTGLTSHYHYLKYFSTKLKIKKVYHFYPPEVHYRYGFMNQDSKLDIIGHFFDETKNENEKYLWEKYLMHESHNKFHQMVYKDAISNVCKEIGCEYLRNETSMIVWRGNNGFNDPYHKTLTPARDLLHYYVEKHDDIVANFVEKNKLL